MTCTTYKAGTSLRLVATTIVMPAFQLSVLCWCSEAKVKAGDYVTAYYMLHSSDKPSLIDEKEVCRTIFVGGLTQGATADMLRGLFSGFGTILVSGVMLLVLFYYATLIYTVKPVLRDHCHERPPVLKDNKFLAEGPKFQYN